MSEVRVIRATPSAAFIPESHGLRRLPRHPKRVRPPAFLESFEDRALAYDCFWHTDGARILMVGPPPMNLTPQVRAARYVALPSKTLLSASHHPSLSTMVTALSGAPKETTEIVMQIDGLELPLPVRSNMSSAFAGKRVLFTMSKDNDLDWIDEWARWHVTFQDADSIIVFDNGSTRYDIAELEKTLVDIPGVSTVSVISWPWRYGMTDPALAVNPFYILFLQVSAMSVLLRRFGAQAYGILNADVDELVATPKDTSIFDLARDSRHGLVVMKGRYMEAVPVEEAPAEGRRHRHFQSSLSDPARALSRPKKWALDPTRPWVANLGVHPYMHWIEGRPLFGKSTPKGVFYRHFRGINTNWKDNRTDASTVRAEALSVDTAFAEIVGQSDT